MIYEDFVTDYNNWELTAHDVRRINNLNSREYSKIRALAVKNGDIPAKRHMNSTGAKFCCQTPQGDWTVQKQYGNSKIYIGRFPDKDTAEMIVKKCKEVNWQLNEIKEIINLHKIKPKNYTLVNGYYLIQKTIDGKLETYYCFKQNKISEDDVKKIVDELRNLNWQINDKQKLLQELGVEIDD